jgi:ATP-dependent protease ClpP protease subunit
MSRPSYLEQTTNKNGESVGNMRIYTSVGEGGVNAANFANEIENYDPKKRLNVYINSIGGSVIEGFGILSAMLNFKDKGGDLHTYNDGIAASTAGWLLLAADPKNVHSKDYAILMLHGVKNDVEGGLFKNSILTIFKNRSGLDVSNLMENGKDNFFNAVEASNMGFFPKENIQNTGLKIDLPENYSLLEISNKIQKIDLINNPNSLKMLKIINLLKLQEGASEEVVASAVKNALELTEKSTGDLLKATNKLATQSAKITELEGQVEETLTSAANSYVDVLIKDGKFAVKNEADKLALVNQYKEGPESFKAFVAMMPVKAANVINGLGAVGTELEAIISKIDNRSLRTLEREDSTLLAKVKNEAKSEYVKLWNKEYNTNKTEADFS